MNAAFAALSLVSLAAAGASAQSYSLAVVQPLPGHSTVSINALNGRGEAVGVSFGSPINNQAPYLWRPGVGTVALPLPPGFAYSVPTDINDDGVIVGFAQPTWSAEQSMVAWTWDGASFRLFPGVSFGNAINASGEIVGRACLSGTQLTCYFRAGPAGAMQTVGPANFYSSTQWRLVDNNDAGDILYTNTDGTAQAQLRAPDGSLAPLPAPTLPYRRTYTWAVNNSRLALARWEYNIGTQYFSRAFVWSQDSGAVEIGIPNVYVRGRGLNNAGQVVGESSGNQNGARTLWLWSPDRPVLNLNDTLQSMGIVGVSVHAINDSGQIAATGISLAPPSPDVAVILTPAVPDCPADYNGSGGTPDDADIAAFFADWNAGDPRADFNRSGGVPDDADIAAFFNAWNSGC